MSRSLLVSEGLLVVLIMLEPPGPLEDDKFKSFSAGFEQHQGLALVFFFLGLLLMKRVGREISQWFRCLCMLATAVGGVGLMLYPRDTSQHNYFAAAAMLGPLVFNTVLWWFRLTWGAGVVLGWGAGIVAFLVANITSLNLGGIGLMGWMELTVLVALGIDWAPVVWDI